MTKNKNELKTIWAQVGFIVHLSQMVEYNLANIISADEILKELNTKESIFLFEYNDLAKLSNDWYKILSKSTLGKIIKKAKQINFFTPESYLLLENGLKKRNYVIHQFFKDDLTKKILDIKPLEYFDQLAEIVDILNKINNELLTIFEQQKRELKKWH